MSDDDVTYTTRMTTLQIARDQGYLDRLESGQNVTGARPRIDTTQHTIEGLRSGIADMESFLANFTAAV